MEIYENDYISMDKGFKCLKIIALEDTTAYLKVKPLKKYYTLIKNIGNFYHNINKPT